MKAHIIPKSFFVEHAEPNEIPRLVTTAKNVPPKKSPVGVYDPKILCKACEARFSPYDDYGYQFFHTTKLTEAIFPGTGKDAYVVRDVNYKLLKLFVLSILWRASVSDQPFYRGVRLGPYEHDVRQLIVSDDPGRPDQFPLIIHRFEHPAELVPILCPVSNKIEGVHFYQLLLNGFLVLTKVDRRPLQTPLRHLMLSPHAPLVVVSKNFYGSQEHKITVKTAQNVKAET